MSATTTETTPDYSWLDEPMTAAEYADMIARQSSHAHDCMDHLDADGTCTLCGWYSHESDL